MREKQTPGQSVRKWALLREETRIEWTGKCGDSYRLFLEDLSRPCDAIPEMTRARVNCVPVFVSLTYSHLSSPD